MVARRETNPNPATRVLEPGSGSNARQPAPEGLLAEPANDAILRGLGGRSIARVDDLSRDEVVHLARLAAIMESIEIAAHRPLWGKIIITAFFEASTRTRTSFESAALRLDGRVISIPDGQLTGVKKGESLEDIGEMFNAYGDMVIVRHSETDALDRIRQNLRLPMINAGNGTGEHPTQALADFYALMKWRPDFVSPEPAKPPIQLGILGTPGSMRAVKSFLLMAMKFAPHFERVVLVSEMADPLGDDLQQAVDQSDLEVIITNDMQACLPELDVIYMNSITLLGDSYKAMDSQFKLDSRSNLKKDAVIMHPLARLNELDTSLDDTRHNLYWNQAHGAVFLRQALYVALFNRLGRLPENIPLK